MFLLSCQYWNHCYLCRRNPTSIVECWNLLYVIGSSLKLSKYFIISSWIGWDNYYHYWCYILRSIIIWEDLKVVVQINQGQPLYIYLYLYYIVTLFFLTRIYCVKIYYYKSEFVCVHYYWEDLKVVVKHRFNQRHNMLLFVSEIIDVNYQLWNQKIISLLGGNIAYLLSYLFVYI